VTPAAKLAVNALPESGHAGMALLPASAASPELKSSVTVSITTAMASSTTNRTLAPPFAVRARSASTPEEVVFAQTTVGWAVLSGLVNRPALAKLMVVKMRYLFVFFIIAIFRSRCPDRSPKEANRG